ncbi:MAG: hypothetical protein IH836_10590 [Proteobacteria bacterium]|nr:hypothetical protein [Pseudomonadota bacterium]
MNVRLRWKADVGVCLLNTESRRSGGSNERQLSNTIDELKGNEAIGRSHADATEIDGQVIIQCVNNLNPGDQVKVLIESFGDYDFWGRLTE